MEHEFEPSFNALCLGTEYWFWTIKEALSSWHAEVEASIVEAPGDFTWAPLLVVMWSYIFCIDAIYVDNLFNALAKLWHYTAVPIKLILTESSDTGDN